MARVAKHGIRGPGWFAESAAALLVICAFAGCWGPADRGPGTPGVPASEAPQEKEGPVASVAEPTPAPRPAPPVDTLAPPKPAPEKGDEAASAAPRDADVTPDGEGEPGEEGETPETPPEKPGFTLANLNRMEEGMSYGEVAGLVGPPGVTVARDGTSSTVYKWNKEGASFLAKFKDGKLVRKSTIRSKTGEKVEGEKKDSPELTEDQYHQVREGMDLEEVLTLLDVEAHAVSDGGGDVAIYRWQDEKGSRFTARFEGGKLVRKSGIYVASMERSGKAEGESEAEAAAAEAPEEAEKDEPGAMAEEGEIEGEEAEEPEAEEPARRRRRLAVGEAWPSEEPDQDVPPPQSLEPEPERRVSVAGETRRTREAEEMPPELQGRSYKPKAKLPDCTYSLRRGSYEVRIYNEGGSRVEAGLRAGKRGKDLSISPGSRKSVWVDQGVYQLYFIYNNAPYTLNGGQSINIDGVFLTDVEIHLIDEAAEIGIIDYARDR